MGGKRPPDMASFRLTPCGWGNITCQRSTTLSRCWLADRWRQDENQHPSGKEPRRFVSTGNAVVADGPPRSLPTPDLAAGVAKSSSGFHRRPREILRIIEGGGDRASYDPKKPAARRIYHPRDRREGSRRGRPHGGRLTLIAPTTDTRSTHAIGAPYTEAAVAVGCAFRGDSRPGDSALTCYSLLTRRLPSATEGLSRRTQSHRCSDKKVRRGICVSSS